MLHDDVLKLLKRVLPKLTSARFIVTILIAGTLCYSVHRTFDLISIDATDKELLMFRKEVFMYVMGAFTGIVGSVISSYFTRADRSSLALPPEEELPKPRR